MKALIFSLFAVGCFAGGVNLPTKSSCVSPDLRWIIRCASDSQLGEYTHLILLGRLGAKEEVRIMGCDRSCDVLWSDDSQRAAITDWSGSNLSEVYIIEVASPKAKRLEMAAVDRSIPKDELEGHNYHEAVRWESARSLEIRVFGHTDENPSHGFCYYLSVDTLS